MVFELGDGHLDAARTFLLRAPERNLPILASWESGTGAFLGAGSPERLDGLALLDPGEGLAIVSVATLDAARALGVELRARRVETFLAEREPASLIWREIHGARKPRFAFDQVLLQITPADMGPYTCPQLRRARAEDLPEVIAIARAMFLEEIGLSPAPGILESHVAAEVEAEAVWVVEEGGCLAFMVQAASRSSHGVELQRVYTLPALRRRGLATLAIGQLCRTLLGSLPRVTLRVNETNKPALALYRKLGFSPCARMKLLCV